MIKISNEKGFALVTTLLFLMVLALMAATATHSTLFEMGSTGNYHKSQAALYIAEAGLRHAIKVANTKTYPELYRGADNDLSATTDNGYIFKTLSFGGGNYTVRITEKDGTWNDADGKAIITATGVFGGTTRVVTTEVKRVPPEFKAAIMANGKLKLTGNMVVNGQNHRSNGTADAAGTGILAASTIGDTDFDTSSVDIGGTTAAGIDKFFHHPTTPLVIETSGVVEGLAGWTAPTTPDKALGLPEGTLKNIAMSGINGSQYTTDPSTLSFPLTGVTYVENVSTWNNIDFGSDSWGILVVHNATTTAKARNLKKDSIFKGIIIADDLETLKNVVRGAIIILSSGTVHAGTADGQIYYSAESIKSAIVDVPLPLKILSWKE